MTAPVLWRAIALEDSDTVVNGCPEYTNGDPIGRASGYLSRSSAKAAGERAGIEFRVVRSEPVVFKEETTEGRQAAALAHLRIMRDNLEREARIYVPLARTYGLSDEQVAAVIGLTPAHLRAVVPNSVAV